MIILLLFWGRSSVGRALGSHSRGHGFESHRLHQKNQGFAVNLTADPFVAVQLTVELPHEFKGTHMSRFVEVLNEWSQEPISSRDVECILCEIASRTDAQQARIEMTFQF